MLRVLIADDHMPVRFGIKILAQEVYSKCDFHFAASGSELFSKLKEGNIDILITDLNMPEVQIMQLVPKALEILPKLKILVMSVNPEEVFARKIIADGAYGYLQKDASDEDMINAIRAVGLGKRFISTTQLQNLDLLMRNAESLDNPFQKLSSREMEVALLLLKGYGPLEVSNELNITSSTASSLKARLYDKLGVSNLVSLVELARLYGLADAYRR